MISKSLIEDLSVKWRTQEFNIAREYAQHVLLSALYGADEDIKLAFKGGAALRLLRQSPRFSEDLDFTGWAKAFHSGRYVELAVKEASRAGLEFKTLESNKTSGGWFALMEARVHDWPVRVEWNISLRAGGAPLSETVLVGTPLWLPYSVRALPAADMASEKLEALFRREKPRDFFDIYYLLRNRLGVAEIAAQKTGLIKCVRGLNPKAVKNELKQFLPRSQGALISRFPEILERELERL
ncbi:MAG: nucleotidyl transferase AbiEii/AbiGii toxin family protein [Elusimicrobia bacterium]|nr:nucleotidyl transferase AbiEii/AbiGii toxin family protein [Elusimicrobiota bacterium]